MANWGGAAGGAATGAAIGSAVPGIGTAIGAGVGGLIGLFSGKKKAKGVKDLRSPEQKAAQQALQQLAMTGSFGGINLGEEYGGQLGAYDASGQQTSHDQLMGLFSGQDLGTARNLYTQLANEKFDPSDPSSGYAAFQRQLDRSGKEAGDVLNREAAISGNRFGTAILGEKADLASRMQDQSASYLANLWQANQANRLAGAQGLQNVTGMQANLSQAASHQQAAVNAMKDQQAKDMLNEYKRQRSEQLSRIDLLSSEANRNPYMGVSSIPQASPFSGLVNSVMGSIGQGLGNKISSSFGQSGGTAMPSAKTLSSNVLKGLF